ncbi:phosphocholine cytidylyltransferase family protein [Paraclostridium sordellii]|uniref:Nucleotidyl transferase n=1 Tax=Paraclostridium sordellii TaxID=1505 RepID=A0A9P1L507_PARSO|nr:phosphocholine cytidylyltransferase family protein [Paeniclostridium sordellii]CEN25983.1 nucleotidyl transferase [[Clostridium] sordellii] [Paeniclostridium sordellii]CEO33552.1 nucleotidyl transferase [[Clostridium] sordellii] [Paeniclostridium sordellii]
MKVIILAAGIGSRLKPLTANVPKSLLMIDNNISVLERTLTIINKNCEAEVVVVTGYCKDQINKCISKFNNVKSVHNPFYKITNSISSLWFAKEYMDDDVIILNADVILEERLFKYLVNIQSDASVLYDSSIGHEADYKVYESNGKVVVMSKDIDRFSGEYVGVTKLKRKESIKVMKKIEKMIDNELFNEWYETALVDMIFNDNLKLDAIDVCDYSWTEIDNVQDLIKAKEILNDEKNIFQN